jgi:hypothetical protein
MTGPLVLWIVGARLLTHAALPSALFSFQAMLLMNVLGHSSQYLLMVLVAEFVSIWVCA